MIVGAGMVMQVLLLMTVERMVMPVRRLRAVQALAAPATGERQLQEFIRHFLQQSQNRIFQLHLSILQHNNIDYNWLTFDTENHGGIRVMRASIHSVSPFSNFSAQLLTLLHAQFLPLYSTIAISILFSDIPHTNRSQLPIKGTTPLLRYITSIGQNNTTASIRPWWLMPLFNCSDVKDIHSIHPPTSHLVSSPTLRITQQE